MSPSQRKTQRSSPFLWIATNKNLDVNIISGFVFFFNDRLVLSAVSDYFAAMFTNNVREAKQDEIKMEGVDPEALRSLVHFAYTG